MWKSASSCANSDLSQHAKASGKPQEIFDEASKKKFVPHVIEPAVGVDRIFLAVLCAAYVEEDVTEEKGNVEKRIVLRQLRPQPARQGLRQAAGDLRRGFEEEVCPPCHRACGGRRPHLPRRALRGVCRRGCDGGKGKCGKAHRPAPTPTSASTPRPQASRRRSSTRLRRRSL